MKVNLIVLLSLLLFSFGCKGPAPYLLQPTRIPVFISSYKSTMLQQAKNIPCSLDAVRCAENATMQRVTLSGMREGESVYPVREIVTGEVVSMIDANFRRPNLGESARLEIQAETQRVILERDGDELSFNLVMTMRLLNSKELDKPYFVKVYSVRTAGVLDDDYDHVPPCVYEAVQKVVSGFVTDISSDNARLARIVEQCVSESASIGANLVK